MSTNQRSPRRQIPEPRTGLYHFGMVLTVIGFVAFMSLVPRA
jgi:hypothetical protein